MYTKWTSNLRDPEMKERFQNQVLSAKPVLERLTDILTTAKNEMEDAEINKQTHNILF